MNNVLGLIDSLEALLLECPKIPMTDKLVVEEKKILQLIDKIRMTVKNGDVARQSIDINKESRLAPDVQNDSAAKQPRVSETFAEAQEKARKVKQGANEYAEYVLSNLQLSVSKLQNQLIKLEKSIENGREVLDHQKSGQEIFTTEE